MTSSTKEQMRTDKAKAQSTIFFFLARSLNCTEKSIRK